MDLTNVSPARRAVLERIEEYERTGRFDEAVEEDPPCRELMPNEVDYLNKKLSSKIKTRFANLVGDRFFKGQIEKGEVIIDAVEGEEYFSAFQNGAIVTCNHFAPADNYILFHAIRKYINGGLLYKIIREGNYTNYPGLYGFLFRHCNTLPLSRNRRTMMNMLSAVNTLLKEGKTILIYPEQNMWWNYRKPRPFKVGGFKMAYRANVPVVPAFITMSHDETKTDADGYPLQHHTLHIMPPVYPDLALGEKLGAQKMLEDTFALYRAKYEEVYGEPLVYGVRDKMTAKPTEPTESTTEPAPDQTNDL